MKSTPKPNRELLLGILILTLLIMLMQAAILYFVPPLYREYQTASARAAATSGPTVTLRWTAAP